MSLQVDPLQPSSDITIKEDGDNGANVISEEAKKRQERRNCYAISIAITLSIGFGLVVMGLIFLFDGILYSSHKENLQKLKNSGVEGKCHFNYPQQMNASIRCRYTKQYTSCSGGGKGGSSCTSHPATFTCWCPLELDFYKKNNYEAVFKKWTDRKLTVIPLSFKEFGDSKEGMHPPEALKYNVDAPALCTNSKRCHRYSCEEGRCCSLGLEGDMEYSDCEKNCHANSNELFTCTKFNDRIFGDWIPAIEKFVNENQAFYMILVPALGGGSVAALVVATILRINCRKEFNEDVKL